MAIRCTMSLICMVALVATPCAADTPYTVPGTVFACTIGQRQVSVTQDGGNFTYRFGTRHSAEKTIIGSVSRSNLFWRSELFAHASQEQMRFRDGRYSYVLYVDFSTPNYDGEGARDNAGIVVFNGTQRIATLHCDDTAYFELTQEQIAILPVDSAQYVVF